jgi:hypothetical protein
MRFMLPRLPGMSTGRIRFAMQLCNPALQSIKATLPGLICQQSSPRFEPDATSLHLAGRSDLPAIDEKRKSPKTAALDHHSCSIVPVQL